METKKEYRKIIFLLIIIFALSAIYAGTFIFDTHNISRNSAYVWLDRKFLAYIDRIEIYGPAGVINLQKKNNVWVMPGIGPDNQPTDYPVKQIRVEDLLAELSKPGNYPVRSSSAALQDVYGLGENSSRITVRGGAGPPLLDLLVGNIDLTGQIFLRKAGQAEIRSGNDRFTMYTDNERSFWYDLRIFPDLNQDMIQRIHFSDNEKIITLTRNRNYWINESNQALFTNAESLVRYIIEAQAEDFIFTNNWEICKSIILELGDGSTRILNIGPPDYYGSCPAAITGSKIVFSLAEWTIKRIFPD